MILPTGSGIYAGQLSERKDTGANQNKHGDETIGKRHRATLNNCESHCGSDTGPAVTDNPTGSDGL